VIVVRHASSSTRLQTARHHLAQPAAECFGAAARPLSLSPPS
jgi:hypothetical protein